MTDWFSITQRFIDAQRERRIQRIQSRAIRAYKAGRREESRELFGMACEEILKRSPDQVERMTKGGRSGG